MGKIRMIKLYFVLLPLLLLAACSTAPKNPSDIYELRRQAETQLDQGNKQADRGDFENALMLLDEAQRLAFVTDDPGLRIRSSLSRGNVLFSLDRSQEAQAEWDAALAESLKENNGELVAVSRIHIARYRLFSGISPAKDVQVELSREMGSIMDKLYTAFAWVLSGLAEKEMGRYGEAEAALKKSLAIHEKERYFEQAAYDWYLIGSSRSLAKNYDAARQALAQAIAFDRRMENSYGLAADWRALGDVHKKAGNPDEAKAAYIRSAQIFRAMGNEAAAAEAEKRGVQ
jgi:tetratricopeptide (TPR) repeat protein